MLLATTNAVSTLRAGAALGIVVVTLVASCSRERRSSGPARERGRVVDSGRLRPDTGARRHRMSPDGLRRIREDEAFVARVYDDGVGNQTIGYGHALQPGESFSAGIAEPKARDLLADDVSRIVNPALDRVTVPLTQNQIDALGSFIYNVGPGNFARFVLPSLNAGDLERVTAQMADFTRGTNQRTGERVALRGLQRRRADEIALFQAREGST
jgi:lysozyme